MFKGLLSKIGLGLPQPAHAQAQETVAQLRDAVAVRLRAEPELTAVDIDPGDPAGLRVQLLDGQGKMITGTVNVTNVHGRLYTLRNDGDRQAAIENLVQSVLATVRKPEFDLNRVFANVRFKKEPTAPSEPASPNAPLTEDLAGDVAVVFQLDTPQSLVGLSYADLGDRPVAELRQAARENIIREMSNLHEERVSEYVVAYQISDNTALTPAIVLTDAFWAIVEKNFPAGALLIMRQRDEVAVIDRRAPSALQLARQLIDMAKQRGIDFLSDRIFERRDGKLVAVVE